jgi:leader peptidase (prepilin peptidase)/N-methyltransferase
MNPWAWLLFAYIAAVTIPLVVIDLRSHRLPNRLVMPGYGVAAVTLLCVMALPALPGLPGPPGPPVLTSLVSAAGYILFLFALSFAGGMGMGDVKLAGVLGAGAGLVSPSVAIASPVLAFVLGGAVSAIILLTRRGTRATRIPFGPFMLLGFWGAVTLGLLLDVPA